MKLQIRGDKTRILLVALVTFVFAGCGGHDGTVPVTPTSLQSETSKVRDHYIYVTNPGNFSVTIYPTGETGNVTPTSTIIGSNTGLFGPRGVAVDKVGEIYVKNYDSSITVYSAGATGNATPISTIIGSGNVSVGNGPIALDAAGNIYVAYCTLVGTFPNLSCTFSVLVYSAGATGNATPIATISGNNTGLDGPDGVAVDKAGKIYVMNSGNNSITVYGPGATGNATPTATIKGSNTGLDSPEGMAVDKEGKIYITNLGPINISTNKAVLRPFGVAVNDAANDIAAAAVANEFPNSSVTVYRPGANGNASPIATIRGSNTGLAIPLGVALDKEGKIYVVNWLTPSLTVYRPGATGNASPIATIVGSNTSMFNPSSVTVH